MLCKHTHVEELEGVGKNYEKHEKLEAKVKVHIVLEEARLHRGMCQ